MTGAELRGIRERLGRSCAQLGEAVGRSAQSVSYYERGRHPVPDDVASKVSALALEAGVQPASHPHLAEADDLDHYPRPVALTKQYDLPTQRFRPTDELGRPGLQRSAGYVDEEFLPELRGQRGARAYREMSENSALVGAALRYIDLLMRRVSWTFEPADDSPEAVDLAEVMKGQLQDMSASWPDTLSEVSSMFVYGYAPLEIVYKRRLGWDADPSRRSRFDDGLFGWRKLSLRSQESVVRWVFDDRPEGDGSVVALVQQPPPQYLERVVPIEKMLLFRTRVWRGNPEGHSLLRNAWWDWFYVKRLSEIAALSLERDGVGVPVAYVPPDALVPGAPAPQAASVTAVRTIVENLRAGHMSGGVFPSSFDERGNALWRLELLKSPGTKTIDAAPHVQRHQTLMALALMVEWILIGHEKAGSWALADTKTGMMARALGGWLDSIADVVNRHGVPRLGRLNGWDPELLPRLEHGDIETRDLKELGDFLTVLANVGYPLFPNSALESRLAQLADLPEQPAQEDEVEVPDVRPPDDVPADEGETVAPGEGGAPAEKYRGQPRRRRGTYSTPRPPPGDVTAALRTLGERLRVGGGDSVDHGMRLDDDPPFRPNRDYSEAVEAAPKEYVDLRSLRASQRSVRRAGVRAFVQDPGLVPLGQRTMAGALEDLPVVFERDGKKTVYDGHHRVAAAMLLGEDRMLARVVRPPMPILPQVETPADVVFAAVIQEPSSSPRG